MPSTLSLRLASAAALTAAMPLVGVAVVPAAVLPAAVADDSSQCRKVSSAEMAWGIKQSFRNYLTGPIAMGGWDLDGVTYTGSADNAADGAFHFTADPAASRVEGDAADLPMNGTMHLSGHGGIINVTLSNFVLQIRGNRAQLLADGRYFAADPAAVASLLGGAPAFTQQPVATFTLDKTLTQAGSASGSATLTGASWIHENLNKALLDSYGEGKNEGDPVTITVATSGSGDCGVDQNAVMATSAGQTDTVTAEQTSTAATQATTQAATAQSLATTATTVTDTGTCDAVTAASVGWGIKQSFRSYLTGPIAMGSWDLDGVGFSGSTSGEDGQFEFTADPSAIRVSGTDADIPLTGSLHLTGHLGALDITYSNMVVKVRGTTAQFIADYRSNTVSSFTAGASVTGAKTGTQVPIAQFTLSQPISEQAAESGTVSLSGPGYITEDGNQSLGGNYGEGNNEADPIDITLNTTGAGCGIGSGTGLDDITSAAQATSGGTSTGTSSTGTPDLGVTPRVSGTASTGSDGDSDTSCSVADGDRKVVETRMGWGIKESFRSYIKGSIAQGDWTTTGGAVYSEGNFVFSGSSGTVTVADGSATSGTLKFGGSVLFTGHEGVLRTVISDPEIQINGSTGSLIANVESNDTSGNATDYGRIELATLSITASEITDGVLDGAAAAALSSDGETALAGFYSAGEALDPVSYRAALSDDCEGDSDASLGDKPENEDDEDDSGKGKVTVNEAAASDSDDEDTGLMAFLKDPSSMVPSLIALIAAIAAGTMAVRLRRTNSRIEEIAAAAGVDVDDPDTDN
ncbi:HtaA domain-containing protein [Corynebacterium terpenotabidum]|uniref:Cell-surface hemin receptor n=1 Tax=Corynebacterium terpenotabidum Y-11 TaxID=1200352 RepID=S4XFU1_9CORY|nr:HtaA domain-containing protein [Corynebacterium terpenotabidum]AGP30505.1 cell-surface hemin receptor [Corynebacterium terpenotabidum Y-11]